MKIRNSRAISALAWLGSGVVRGLIGSVRYRTLSIGEDVSPTRPGLRERYIYAFWHEYLLLPAYHYGRPDVYALISRSQDGQLIAETCEHLGFSVIRGSSTRGGIEAVRQMLRVGRWAHLGITPDGPRGPRRKVQPGMVYLAARTGLPIVAAGFGVKRAWRMRSWDRFCVPKPGTLAACVTAPPLCVPEDADGPVLEKYRRRVEQDLLHVTALAERWAETGVPPAMPERQQGLEGWAQVA